MTEAYTSFENNLRYYGVIENGEIVRYGSQIPFNFDLLTRTNKYTKAGEFKEHIEGWMNVMPKAKKIHANWVVRSFFSFLAIAVFPFRQFKKQNFIQYSWVIMTKEDWLQDMDQHVPIYSTLC